jgi:hypothetical protein
VLIRVEVKNLLLQDRIFWEDDSSNVSTIMNIVARLLAERVAIDGIPRSNGMWFVSEVKESK